MEENNRILVPWMGRNVEKGLFPRSRNWLPREKKVFAFCVLSLPILFRA